MLSDKDILELSIALQAQHHILQKLGLAISELDTSLTRSAQKLSSVNETTRHLRELEALMNELEADQDWIEVEDFGDFNSYQIVSLYENRQQSVFEELTQIRFKDWDSFVRQCQTYILLQGGDPLSRSDKVMGALNRLKALFCRH